jgi:hypothetical protein
MSGMGSDGVAGTSSAAWVRLGRKQKMARAAWRESGRWRDGITAGWAGLALEILRTVDGSRAKNGLERWV